MINKIYLNQDAIRGIKKELDTKKFVMLDEFFNKNFYSSLNKEISNGKFSKREIFDRYSFFETSNKKFENFFIAPQFVEFLEEILGTKIKTINFSARKFQHGNYTLLHDSEKSDGKIEFIFFMTNSWDEKFGGSVFYPGKREPLIVNPMKNRFFIFKGKSRKFVKYVNNLAGKKNFILIGGKINAPR
ncbi:MAG: hypothetical protein AABX93_00300 [Nanoarchaeota archaeon]